MTTVIDRLAEWIAAVDHGDIPDRVLLPARYQFANVIAAIFAGAGDRAARAVLARARKRGSGGRSACTALPSGESMSMADAITVSSAFSMALDYDDYLYMGHTGHSAVLASLAICQAENLSTKKLLTAQVVANEVAGRLGASAVLGPQNGQAWSFIHTAGAAAAAAKLYGHSAEKTAHALAVALYQPPVTLWPGFMGPASKVLTAAGPTVAGICAAELADEGMTGARDVIEHPRDGFWTRFTYAPLPHMLTGLGRAWVTDTIAYKKYPGCAYIDTTMDALFEVLAKCRHDSAAPPAIARIDVVASLLTIAMDNLSSDSGSSGAFGPINPVDVNFSIPLSVAIGALAGRLTATEVEGEFLVSNETAIRDLARRVHLRHDWGMTLQVLEAFDTVFGQNSALSALGFSELCDVIRGYRTQLGGRRKNSLDFWALFRHHGGVLYRTLARTWRRRKSGSPPDLADVDFRQFRVVFPARVTVTTESGQRLSATCEVPLGAPGRDLRFETVAEKFRLEVGRRLGADRADRALGAIENIEDIDVAELVALLAMG